MSSFPACHQRAIQRAGLALLATTLAAAPAAAQPLGTAFTYQGRLTDAGNPPNGSYDLQLVLFDASTGGAQVGPVLTRDDVSVSTGLFTVSLDFGAVFAGQKRWLELRVRPGASTGAYTTLTPRQELAPAPNAAFSGTTPWAGIAGKPAGFADDVDNDSGGDITDVAAGTGLSGGGTSGAVTLSVDFGGNGLASNSSRADHDHTGQVWNGFFATAFRVVNTATIGVFADGIWGQSDSQGNGRGVVGYATGSVGTNFGVWAQADSPLGRGLFGLAAANTGTNTGVWGESNSPAGRGVYGQANGQGAIDSGTGVFGFSSATTGAGIGVRGEAASTNNAQGVLGIATATTGPTYGVRGETRSSGGIGVFALVTPTTGTSYALFATNSSLTGYAGFFAGRVNVTGTLSKGAGSFKIDHPLDPRNKYLYHSFVESPDMMNIYNGNVVTDDEGFATVELPDWFEALNRDFRYQLTVIGRLAQAVVAQEVEDNRFTIQTSAPRVKVSWQVTGIRHDAFAEKHRIPVEEDKDPDERGTYLYPEEQGRPREQGLVFKRLREHHGEPTPPSATGAGPADAATPGTP